VDVVGPQVDVVVEESVGYLKAACTEIAHDLNRDEIVKIQIGKSRAGKF